MLADLRESGCLTADTEITLADGTTATIGALLARRAPRTSRCSPSTSTCGCVPGVMTHVFRERREARVRAAARVGPPRHRQREPPVPHPRRLAAARRRSRVGVAHRVGATTADRSTRARDTDPARGLGLHGAQGSARRRRCAPTTSSSASAATTGATRVYAAGRVALADAPHRRRARRPVPRRPRGLATCSGTRSSRSCRRAKQPVFDATVLGTHNFVADGIVVHNSIEQDADVVMFIYRDEYYNPENSDQRGTRRDHRRQAPQRPHRHDEAGVPRPVHEVRRPRPTRRASARAFRRQTATENGRRMVAKSQGSEELEGVDAAAELFEVDLDPGDAVALGEHLGLGLDALARRASRPSARTAGRDRAAPGSAAAARRPRSRRRASPRRRPCGRRRRGTAGRPARCRSGTRGGSASCRSRSAATRAASSSCSSASTPSFSRPGSSPSVDGRVVQDLVQLDAQRLALGRRAVDRAVALLDRARRVHPVERLVGLRCRSGSRSSRRPCTG